MREKIKTSTGPFAKKDKLIEETNKANKKVASYTSTSHAILFPSFFLGV